MDKEITAIRTAAFLACGAFIIGKACKIAYQAYKQKCFELEIAKGIIDTQNVIIEALQKDKNNNKD